MDPWGLEDAALLARVELLLDGATYASLPDTESLQQMLQGLLVRAQLSRSAGADAQRDCLARVLFCIGLHYKLLVAEEQAEPEPGVEHLDGLAALLEEMDMPAVLRPQCRYWCELRRLRGFKLWSLCLRSTAVRLLAEIIHPHCLVSFSSNIFISLLCHLVTSVAKACAFA